MKLSIITPQYKETEDIIKPLLSSIENQVGFNIKDDLEIIIINDGSDQKLSNGFLKSYKKLNIEYVINEHNGGPSVARNTGLKIASGDYIMFCDADDMLLYIFGVTDKLDKLGGFGAIVPLTGLVSATAGAINRNRKAGAKFLKAYHDGGKAIQLMLFKAFHSLCARLCPRRICPWHSLTIT